MGSKEETMGELSSGPMPDPPPPQRPLQRLPIPCTGGEGRDMTKKSHMKSRGGKCFEADQQCNQYLN